MNYATGIALAILLLFAGHEYGLGGVIVSVASVAIGYLAGSAETR
jgi:hypothetical protein